MDFGTWIDEQDDETKAMMTAHTDGLRSALDSERDARKQLAADLKMAVSSSGDAGEMRQKLEVMQTDLMAASGRADFYANGHKAGVSNLPLAFLAAREAGLVGKDGADFEKLKGDYPELFAGVQRPSGNAGSGMSGGAATGSGAASSMDDLIRQQAGVG